MGKIGGEMKNQKAIFHQCLKNLGLRCTGQRDTILEEFISQKEHITPEALYLKIRKKNPRIGFSTVYRTLKIFTQCQLARVIKTDNGSALFESSFGHPHHDHLICDQCGRLIEFLNNELEKIQEQVAEEMDFVMTGHRLIIHGICSKCRKQ